jgi:hypothetical protein
MTGPILLSSGDLAALSVTGKLLIPTAGSGLANIPFLVICESSTGTAYAGSSVVNIVNGSNSAITTATLTLGVGGTSVVNSSAMNVNGAANAAYTNLNNQGIYLFGGSLTAGGTQTVQVWIHYYIKVLV